MVIDLVESVPTCWGAGNGSITIDVEGGNPPYNIQWSNDANTTTVENLNVTNTLTAVVTDACGRLTYRTFSVETLPVLNIALQGDGITGCPGTAGINISVTGGAPPYNYTWSNGQHMQDAYNLDNDTYTVTVSDAYGCSRYMDFEVQQGEVVEAGVYRPCEGSADGSITYAFEKPDEQTSVTYAIDGGPDIPVFGNEVTIGGLSPNIEYNLLFKIGDCDFTKSKEITHKSTDKEYTGYDEDENQCVYMESCDGVEVGNYFKSGEPNFFEATTNPCKAPIFCDGEDTGHKKKYDKIKVRFIEYQQIINSLVFNGNISDEQGAFLLSAGNASDQGPCNKIKYCPASLEITLFGGLSGSNGDGNIIASAVVITIIVLRYSCQILLYAQII